MDGFHELPYADFILTEEESDNEQDADDYVDAVRRDRALEWYERQVEAAVREEEEYQDWEDYLPPDRNWEDEEEERHQDEPVRGRQNAQQG